MATLNQVIRERKDVIREIKRLIKAVDTAGEKGERLTNRLLQRRLKVPELDDLLKIMAFVAEQERALRELVQVLRAGFPV